VYFRLLFWTRVCFGIVCCSDPFCHRDVILHPLQDICHGDVVLFHSRCISLRIWPDLRLLSVLDCFFPLKRLREWISSKLVESPEATLSSHCCSPIASRCRTFVFASSKVRLASNCGCCKSTCFKCLQLRRRSRIISSFRVLYSQFSAKRLSSVIYCSVVLPVVGCGG